jgi:photosystem II stability/assembly factor-like uncharacterized protein
MSLFCCITGYTCLAQWTTIPSGTTNNLTQIVFPDPSTGYIITDKPSDTTNYSMVLKTTDGGFHWTPILYKRNRSLKGLDFLNADTGVIVSSTGFDTCYKTYDGGTSWIKTKMQYDVGDLLHMNTANDWVYLRAQHWGSTSDGGATWIDSTDGNLGLLPAVTTDFQFVDDTTIIGFGWYSSEVFKSLDRGLSWSVRLCNAPSTMIQSGCFPTVSEGFYVCNIPNYYQIFKSTDGGGTWATIYSASGFSLNCIRYVDQNKIYAVGSNGYITKTADAGMTWSLDTSGTTHKLNKIVLLPGKAIAIGDSGTILINTSVPSAISEPQKTSLVNIYPNPSPGKFTIEIDPSYIGPYELDIFNITGQLAFSQQLHVTKSKIDLSGQSDGVFFYVITGTNNQKLRGTFYKHN